MTRREDNQLLDTVQAWLDSQQEIQSGYRAAEALIAFAVLLILLFGALHLQVVPV